MKEMMVPEYKGRIDASLSLPIPEFSEGMKVSWDYRGEKRFGTTVKVKGKGAMIRTDEGKEFIKLLKDLTPEVDDTGSYWAPDGGGKRKKRNKRTKRTKRTKKKSRKTKSRSKRRSRR